MYLVPRKKMSSGFWVDPFRELERIQNDMNSLLNVTLTNDRDEPRLSSGWSPSIDYDETPESILIRADVPGIDRKDLDVRVKDDVLILKGERKIEEQRKENGVRLSERSFGQFYRQIPLSTAVDASKIQATYKDGVLELVLPKKEEAKPKQIRVDVK